MSSRRNEGADLVDVRKIEGGEGKRIGRKERECVLASVCVRERERERETDREREREEKGDNGRWC